MKYFIKVKRKQVIRNSGQHFPFKKSRLVVFINIKIILFFKLTPLLHYIQMSETQARIGKHPDM